MEELIKITEYNGKKAVSARELYEKLGFASQHWAAGIKRILQAILLLYRMRILYNSHLVGEHKILPFLLILQSVCL